MFSFPIATPQSRASDRTKLESGEVTVLGDQWPIFLYEGHIFNKENPWSGLLRGRLLVYVSR